jgi:hypothetical protein
MATARFGADADIQITILPSALVVAWLLSALGNVISFTIGSMALCANALIFVVVNHLNLPAIKY